MAIVKSVSTVEGQEVTIYVEVDELPGEKSPYDDTRGGRSEIPEAARDLFEDGLALARNCAKQAVEGINKLDHTFRLEEFEFVNGSQLLLRLHQPTIRDRRELGRDVPLERLYPIGIPTNKILIPSFDRSIR